jgi:hypothetical protein
MRAVSTALVSPRRLEAHGLNVRLSRPLMQTEQFLTDNIGRGGAVAVQTVTGLTCALWHLGQVSVGICDRYGTITR